MRHDKRKSPKRKVLFANSGREDRNRQRQKIASSSRLPGWTFKKLPALHSTGRLLNLYDCIFKKASQDGEASQVHGLYVTHDTACGGHRNRRGEPNATPFIRSPARTTSDGRAAGGARPCGVRRRTLRKVLEYLPQSTIPHAARRGRKQGKAALLRARPIRPPPPGFPRLQRKAPTPRPVHTKI